MLGPNPIIVEAEIGVADSATRDFDEHLIRA
jgi:hypothetical protein